MDRGQVSSRIAALRAECALLGRELSEAGRGLAPDEAFELAGEAQGLANAADALVAVAGAWGARVETTMRSGSWERVHPVGYMDAMAAAQMSLATGLTEGVAGRKAALGAALGERFPRVRDLLLGGEVPAATAQKVVDACAGLDVEACLRVDAGLAPRLAAMDPARVAAEARRVATTVAAAQVAAHAALTKKGRCVEARAGVDGLTDWFASLPTATSAAMWSAVESLAGEYRAQDESLSVPESRADALTDLVLRNVTVTAQVTLGIPVVTDRPAPETVPGERFRVDWGDDETIVDAVTGEEVRSGDLDPATREELSWIEVPAEAEGDLTTIMAEVLPGFAVSGTQLPGLGWVDAATLANLLKTLPMGVARAVLDAETGTLAGRQRRVPAAEGHRRLRHHPRRHLPDVGLLPARGALRPRPRQTLAGGRDHAGRPRGPLPATSSLQAARALATGPRSRRHRHRARSERCDPHHRAPAPAPRLSAVRCPRNHPDLPNVGRPGLHVERSQHAEEIARSRACCGLSTSAETSDSAVPAGGADPHTGSGTCCSSCERGLQVGSGPLPVRGSVHPDLPRTG
ncbi:hypothetical protein [Phycicoccus duodecadis]|uniref:DUF222 domain-containing protein n=1 Tax=Phycicoccus duodecadis TaxID=173053 RepID=A0A2N3YHN6_9MICO|nr:hypothetical protein [Phycicoccus duodecadis]PKW26350.1 hypothetical protein ATL31_1160 [Phycicoccus duodecadis]